MLTNAHAVWVQVLCVYPGPGKGCVRLSFCRSIVAHMRMAMQDLN